MIFSCQGSEEKTVVYVLDNGSHQTWKHVYTAVTRGQSRVYVLAKKDGLKNAIRRHVIKRNTRLEGLALEMLHDLGIAKNDFQPSQSQFSTPKRGFGFQTFQSSPGPSQASPGIMSLKDVTWQNPINSGTGFCIHSSPKSASPSLCKREGITNNCTTPSKQMKVRTLGILSGTIGESLLHHRESLF